MNAFKELVTPRDSAVPVRRSVHHHFKLPTGWVLDNEHSIQNSPLRSGMLSFIFKKCHSCNGHAHARAEGETETEK